MEEEERDRAELGRSTQNLNLPTSVSRHTSVKFLESNSQGRKIEASDASLSINRKHPACNRSNEVYNVAEEEVVKEEEDIDDERE